MDYTHSDAYITHTATGQRMHQGTAPVPTAVSSDDMNMVIWSLMEIVKEAGMTGITFDPANPDSYGRLLNAVKTLFASRDELEPNIVKFGAKADGSTINDTFINAALAASPSGRVLVPDADQPFKVGYDSTFDFDQFVGRGRILWNTLVLDLAKARTKIPKNTISALLARYSRGEGAIAITVYGDSLVAGVGSTNYAPNTGDPAYNSVVDHSWPVMASRTIRQMLMRDTSDGNFVFYNAGYAGQRLDTGWALDNFKSAVLTPYGNSQGLLIAFGHNDANASTGSATLDHIKQLRNLIMFARSYGKEPAILTVPPCARPRSDSIFREIQSMHLQVGAAMDVDVYDSSKYMAQCIAGYGYKALFQDDGVHFTDQGYNAHASSVVRVVAAPWIIDADEYVRTSVPTWDTRTSGWVYNGASDAAWAVNTTHLQNADGFRMLPRFSPGKGASTVLAAYFIWSSGLRRNYLVYRGQTPPENTSPNGGIEVRSYNLSQSGFGQGGAIVSSLSRTDAAGWRRGLIQTPIEMPCPIGELPAGLIYAQVRTGTDNVAATYCGRLDVVGGTAPAVIEFAPRTIFAPEQALEQFGMMHFGMGSPLGNQAFVFPQEMAGLRNVVSFAGGGTQLRMSLSLPEGTGVIVMGGSYLSTADGSVGRWAYFLYRGTGANNTKLYLARYDTTNGVVVLTSSPVASTQNLASGAKVLVLFGKSGNEMALTVYDGLLSSATQLLQHVSTAATSGTTTQAEAPPVAGCAFGGWMSTTAAGNLVQVDWASILRLP